VPARPSKSRTSGAKKNRRDVDVDFVEEPSIQQLLDGVGAVDANGLPGGGGFGLAHGAFDASITKCTVELGRGHPAGTWWSVRMRVPSVVSAPAVGDVEGASAGQHGTKSGREAAKVLALGADTLNVMGFAPPVWISTSPELRYQSNTSATPSLRSAT